MNYKSQACEWTLNISFRAFLKNFPFFEFLYLFITPNSAKKYTRNTNFSIFPLGACSKIPKPKQCTPGKTLPSWCQHRNLFAPKHKILMAGLLTSGLHTTLMVKRVYILTAEIAIKIFTTSVFFKVVFLRLWGTKKIHKWAGWII